MQSEYEYSPYKIYLGKDDVHYYSLGCFCCCCWKANEDPGTDSTIPLLCDITSVHIDNATIFPVHLLGNYREAKDILNK